MNQSIRNVFERELHAGEKLLWASKCEKLMFSAVEQSMIAFTVLWVFLATLVLSLSLVGSDGNYVVTVDGVPREVTLKEYLLFVSIFPIVGFGMIGATIVFSKVKMRQLYAVTDRRCIIISNFLIRQVTSILPGQFMQVIRSEKGEFGIIQFQSASKGWFFIRRSSYRSLSFSRIKNSKRVEGYILSLEKPEISS
jgi:hypothetical protein